MSKPRRAKRALLVGSGLLVLLVLVVLLLPTLAGLGFGRRLVAGAVTVRVQGTAAIDALDLSWLGAQSVKGLRITEPGGREAAQLDVEIDAGLLPLLLGRVSTLGVRVGGALTGDIREDGSTSFGDLFAGPPAPKDPGRTPAPGGGPPLAGVPAANVEITGLALTLVPQGAAAGVPLRFDGLTGRARYAPGGDCDVALDSATSAGDLRGSFKLTLSAPGLFDARGALAPTGTAVDASLAIRSVPVPFAEQVRELRRLDLTARAADLAKELEVTIGADTLLTEGEPSTLDGRLTLASPITADGRVNVGLDTVRGELTGSRVPTALLQPALAAMPVVLSRDVGPSCDVTARFAPGSVAGAPTMVAVTLTAERLNAQLAARVNQDGSVEGDRATLEARVHPDLASGLAGRPVLAAPARAKVEISSFRLPARLDDGTLPLRAIALTGALLIEDPFTLLVDGESEPGLTVGDVRLTVATPGLAGGVHVGGGAAIEGGRLEVDVRMDGLIDERGELVASGIVPIGTVSLRDVDGSRVLARLRPRLAGEGGTPLVRTLADELVRGVTSATLTTAKADAGAGAGALRAGLLVTTDRLRATADVVRGAAGIDVKAAAIDATVTPAIATAVLSGGGGTDGAAGGEPGLGLEQDAKLAVAFRPFTLPAPGDDGFAWPATPIEMDARLETARLTHPSLAEPVVVRDLVAAIGARLGAAPQYTARGELALDRKGKAGRVGRVRYDVVAKTAGEQLVPAGSIDVTDLSVRDLEALLGRTAGEFAAWVGDTGALGVTVAGGAAGADGGANEATTYTVRSALPNVRGTLTASVVGAVASVTTSDLAVTLPGPALQAFLAPPPEEGAKTPPPGVTIAADVPLQVRFAPLRVPMALLRGEPFAPADVELGATLTGGPLRVADADGVVSAIEDLSITLDARDLAAGLRVEVGARATGRGTAETGLVSLKGRVQNLVSASSTLDPAGGALDMEAKADRVPTVIADALLGLRNRLVAAVGPVMKVDATARGFSRSSGRLEGRIETPNGFLDGLVLAREGELRTSEERPPSGELALTPALRRELLAPLHPIFADVRAVEGTVEQPIRFRVTAPCRVPTTGDVSQLKADLEITVGKVEFVTGSEILGLMQLFAGAKAKETLPGSIEPIAIRIRDGIVNYDRFAVRVERYTLRYDGRIDLVQRTVDLRTEVPLDALAMSFTELKGYADKIVVPLVTRGPFGKTRTEIDPKFDIAGAAAAAGFQGALGEVLGDKNLGGAIGNIINDALGGNKEKKKKD